MKEKFSIKRINNEIILDTNIKTYKKDLEQYVKNGGRLNAANFSGLDLSGINLSGANLLGANFENVNLEGANLSNSYLRLANLKSTLLKSACFRGANLTGSDLSNSDMRKSVLNGAKVFYTTLTDANLDNAILGKGLTLDLLFARNEPKSSFDENDIRITAVITNKIKDEVIFLKSVDCNSISNFPPSKTLGTGDSVTVYATTNDRVFLTLGCMLYPRVYRIAMTCPKSSDNSATGYTTSGLQHYKEHGTPVDYKFNLGELDQADWDNGDKDEGNRVTYGDCS